MEIVSIGPYCITAEFLRLHGFRNNAYPFDWIFSSFEIVKHCIDDKFKTFLDMSYIIHTGTCGAGARHEFYHQFIDTPILRNHQHKYRRHMAEHKRLITSMGMFWHQDPRSKNHYNDYTRRCNRLLELIESGKKICFVYTDTYTKDYDDFIDFCKHFEKYTNIYIVGFYGAKVGVGIVYENVNCKIFGSINQKTELQNIIFKT